MQIYLVRHGQTKTNLHFEPGIIRPKTEPLTELGCKQANEVATHIASLNFLPTIIVTSPYTRALETAFILHGALHIPVQEDDRLAEYNLGVWGGKNNSEIEALFDQLPARDRYTFRPTNGESWDDEAQRFNAVIQKVKKDNHSSAVFVSHYDPIKSVISLLLERSPEDWSNEAVYPPGSVTILSQKRNGWEIV